MAEDRENRFRPKLGKIRARGGKQAKRFINRVLNAAARAGPLLPGGPGTKVSYRGRTSLSRGRTATRMMGGPSGSRQSRVRRVVIKARIVKLAGTGIAKAQAHLRYVERDGTGGDGEPGRLYDAAGDQVDGDKFMERCEGDRHQFRFIVSPEDAAELEDLKPFVRDLMSQMEQDLGTKLDWLAVDHFNTDNPHSHVIVRGKDDQGKDLVIARDYISHGMRQRASELLTLELGPRTDLEIQKAMRREVDQDRFSGLDRRMLKAAEDRVLDLRYEPEGGYERFNRSVMIGRLLKLKRMGLARVTAPGLWRFSDDLESTLRRAGERGDIIKTMHAEMRRQSIEHAEADYAIYDPRAEGARSIVGRIVSKGLSDELYDRTYLIVDGVDGQAHYVDIGHDPQADDYQTGAIFEIAPRTAEPMPADRVIAEVAAGNDGIYSAEAHARHDRRVSPRFAEAHIRRLEALRRAGYVMRMPDGVWAVPEDYLDRAAEYEADRGHRQPVSIAILSRWELDRQISAQGATWLDRQLVSGEGTVLASTGFGKEVADALARRRAHLVTQGLAHKTGDRIVYQRALLRTLRQRELARAGARLANETGLAYRETKDGDQVEGIYRRPVDLASGRFALFEQTKEFTLVPWRSVLERARDKSVSGLVRGDTISWDITRRRGLSIS